MRRSTHTTEETENTGLVFRAQQKIRDCELDAKKHLFNLPDGSTLKFAPPYLKGLQANWFYSFDDKRVWEASEMPKGKQYRLNLWSSFTDLNIVAADFDELSPAFSSFDALALYLSSVFSPDEAIVSRSSSNKVKVFFLVKTPPNIEISHEIALDTLARIFDFDLDLFALVDRNLAALRVTYLNKTILKDLNQRISSLTPIACVLPELGSGEDGLNTNTTLRSVPYRSYRGDIAAFFTDVRLIGASERFVRILLESRQLLSPNGFGISTRKVSREIKASQQRVSTIRKRFVNIGWLQSLGQGYVPGKLAKRFKASGQLANALRQIYPHVKSFEIPKFIPAGQWNSQVGRLVGRMFHAGFDIERTLAFIRSIDGSSVGDRMRQATKWFKWYESREKRNKSSGVAYERGGK